MTDDVRKAGRAIRPRVRRWRGVGIAGVVATAGTLALVALRQPASESGHFTLVEQQETLGPVASDPLRAELIRCGSLPPQADDPACRAAWEENRRRFFGEAAVQAPATTSNAGER